MCATVDLEKKRNYPLSTDFSTSINSELHWVQANYDHARGTLERTPSGLVRSPLRPNDFLKWRFKRSLTVSLPISYFLFYYLSAWFLPCAAPGLAKSLVSNFWVAIDFILIKFGDDWDQQENTEKNKCRLFLEGRHYQRSQVAIKLLKCQTRIDSRLPDD